MKDLILIGDEAWTPEEWAAEQKRRSRRRVRHPETWRRWRLENLEHRRAYNREWMRLNRPHVVGSLHDLACTGPTRAEGCVCKKIKCYDRPRQRVA